MSFSAIGLVCDNVGFRAHLAPLNLGWAKSVTVHHTAFPDLKMRPKGFVVQHMRNIAFGYEHTNKWNRGPHFFTDEDQIFGFSPVTEPGIHAVSFNANSIGIEALGNYDVEDPKSGRGLEVWKTTAACVAALLVKMNLEATSVTVKFHRDDPRTKKTCPGKLVAKGWFLDMVKEAMAFFHHEDSQADRADPVPVPEAPGTDVENPAVVALQMIQEQLKGFKTTGRIDLATLELLAAHGLKG